MQLDYALLADSAQVSEGKTYILGGGISILWRQEFPAILGFSLVAQFSYERTEASGTRQITFVVIDADGNRVIPDIQGELRLGETRPDLPRNVPLVAPLIVSFPQAPVIERDGAYDVQILIDGNHVKTLPFAVVQGRPARPAVEESE